MHTYNLVPNHDNSTRNICIFCGEKTEIRKAAPHYFRKFIETYNDHTTAYCTVCNTISYFTRSYMDHKDSHSLKASSIKSTNKYFCKRCLSRTYAHSIIFFDNNNCESECLICVACGKTLKSRTFNLKKVSIGIPALVYGGYEF